MFGLSQTTGYAIAALSCLGGIGGRRVMAPDIAACTHIPRSYLSKILSALVKSGLVHAKRGYRGGYSLAKSPDGVTLLEVIEAVEGDDWLANCLIESPNSAHREDCPTHEFWQEERQRIVGELKRITLADVATLERKRLANPQACCGATPDAADVCSPVARKDS